MRPNVIISDGGRAAAGYKGTARDCGVRAVALALGLTYEAAYADLRAVAGETPRNGLATKAMHAYMDSVGARWTACMSIGAGCTVHVRASELPRTGRHILRLSRHYAAWIDGALHDSHDSSREGTRCVYGFWTLAP